MIHGAKKDSMSPRRDDQSRFNPEIFDALNQSWNLKGKME